MDNTAETLYRKFSTHAEFAEMLRRNIEVIRASVTAIGVTEANDVIKDCITRLHENNKEAKASLDLFNKAVISG
jgi:hypothetical protein